MQALLDVATLDRFRRMSPREAFDEARDAVFRMGGSTSEDFLEVYEALVDQGILSWDQIAEFEG